MKHIKIVFLILLYQGLIACSTFVKPQRLPEFPLFNPADLGLDIQLTQIVTSQVNDLPQVMLAAWSIEDEKMSLVGLTVTGQEILRLQYDGKELIEEYSPLLNVPINGRIVISQIQLAYWPFDKIEQQLKGTSWKLLQDDQQRNITFKDHSVTTIKDKSGTITPAQFSLYWPELIIESPALDQQLTIRTISAGKKNEK